MIKNIIFDVGKVLVEWAPEEAMRKLGMDDAAVQAVADATVRSKAWDACDRSAKSSEEILADLVAGAPEYEKEICLFWENVGMAIWQYDYVKEWMRALKEKGYRLYILSNYGEWAYDHTREALSFLTDVDGALFSFQVKQIKPEPGIYQSLLKKYDLIPEECVFMDDHAENIEAAHEQGFEGFVFTTYEDAVEKLKGYGVS